MSGRLAKMYICRKKGDARESVYQARLDKELGLIGDYKSESGDKDRQLVILQDTDREEIDNNYIHRGICTRRFQENILIEGFNFSRLDVDTRFKIGQSVITITSVGKGCFEECELVRTKELCPLKEGVLFAKVVESGIVSVGDKIIKE